MFANPLAIRPLGNRVLVQVLQEELQRRSGLVIPSNVKRPSCQGLIVAAAPGVCDLMPGDVVLFDSYQENQIFPDPADPTDEYLLIEAGSIMLVLEDDPYEHLPKLKPGQEPEDLPTGEERII